MVQPPTVTGINHLTFAVRDLDRSLAFYVEVLGLCLVARWQGGAYLRAGAVWIALFVDDAVRSAPHPDYTHTAFGVSSAGFAELAARVLGCGAEVWQQNQSEGASLYVLDPDGHRLELHVGDLEDRVRSLRANPPPGLQVFV
ncbi:MAG TPA: VOC family protein [Candidatus Ozemobacteraceae bacterium]|nr:VOC family protein [Candidatus Ozemobacteraceae bacterium]